MVNRGNRQPGISDYERTSEAAAVIGYEGIGPVHLGIGPSSFSDPQDPRPVTPPNPAGDPLAFQGSMLAIAAAPSGSGPALAAVPGRALAGQFVLPPLTPYLDYPVVPATFRHEPRLKSSPEIDPETNIFRQDWEAPCASVIVGECDKCGQRVLKVIYCGKEWCPACGQEGSPTHIDRYAGWLKKAKQLQSIGYFVITWPEKYRKQKDRLYSTAGLRKTSDKVVEILAGKRSGRLGRTNGYFTRGLARWHWFGDTPGKYHPHLNILVESGFIQPEKLEEIKAALRQGLDCPGMVINYEYRSTPAQMAHTVRYVTRPTFLDREWDPYLAKELFETKQLIKAYEDDPKSWQKNHPGEDLYVTVPFRNSRTWGKWTGAPAWSMAGDEKYEKINSLRNLGACPSCNNKMRWSEVMPFKYLKLLADLKIIDPVVPGYYLFREPEYEGNFKGVDPVLVVNGLTGELEPVNVNDPMRKKLLRGDYDRAAMFVQEARRHVAFINQCKRRGIPLSYLSVPRINTKKGGF